MATPAVLLYAPDGMQFDLYGGSRGTGKNLGRTAPIAPGGQGSTGGFDSLQRYPFGTRMVLQDGRSFRFSVAGAADLVVGNLLEAAANIAGNINQTAVASAAGARQPQVTVGATSTTGDQYAGGYANVSVTPDLGSIYLIDNHAAATNGTTQTLNLAPGHVLHNAWTTTSRVDFIKHPNDGVIQSPATTAVGIPVGVAVSVIKAYNTNGQALAFGWIQTAGIASMLISGTIVLGGPIVRSGVAAGAGSAALITVAGSTQSKESLVGYAQILTATATGCPIKLILDPS